MVDAKKHNVRKLSGFQIWNLFGLRSNKEIGEFTS